MGRNNEASYILIVFSLQRNKAWNGTGFIMKPGKLELSSICFAEQSVNIGSGKYKVKLIGSSISGNGVFSLKILSSEKEIESKTMLFNSRSNTEVSFDIELYEPGPYCLKLSRGKESIGRIEINLFTLFKVIELKPASVTITSGEPAKTGRIFFVIDYDKISSASQLSDIFGNTTESSQYFFLVKTSDQFTKIPDGANYRLFFEWCDLFDYLLLVSAKKVMFSESNISAELFVEYNLTGALTVPVRSNNVQTIKLSGTIF
jgi:hypothetical protein